MSEYSPEELQQALQNVRNELNQGHMQEIMKVWDMSVQEKCFNICLTSPGASLSNKDKTCLGNCVDRYIDTMQEVSKALSK
ncbi:mitochondrial import inner membrane translocase subunit TIM13-like protein [Blastocystis sp. subtype 4]|uniref:mitochondrial import inner membrane translocase subunit TIM13-like protein n=1 Tax=Blastocystis sp. subtype 4 TaxID=944170 RepID=UPI0007118BEF|nr:mitochondrial import inner membrane translocase subunit TIM13-like protein [Blastocystis sp. subtype 4]KNB44590.1 mitochondrial import inner membrane translocase subunit TIM13-like protein [Blastocystis sp. subtype 4]|eukprot:XP_014528033.1 mitochondrial import inner membrane translocase subunit TIM13-like protein [Blastocystis sp. subtype 4]